MSTDSTIEFLKEIARDPALADELIKAQDCEEFLARAASIGERIGHVPDQSRLQAAIDRKAAEGPEELADSDLEDVGGGFWFGIEIKSFVEQVKQGNIEHAATIAANTVLFSGKKVVDKGVEIYEDHIKM